MTVAAMTVAAMSMAAMTMAQAQSTIQLGNTPEVQSPAPNVIDLGPGNAKESAKETSQTPKPKQNNNDLTNAGKQQAGKEGAPIITRYGDWEVACAKSGSPCIMAQIGKNKQGTPILEMSVRKLPQPQSVQGVEVVAVTDIITPLAVVLTSGVLMQIDSAEEQRAPYQICTAQGCLVREPLTSEAVNRFKKGNQARLTVVSAEQGEVVVSVSLAGFTKAFSNLK